MNNGQNSRKLSLYSPFKSKIISVSRILAKTCSSLQKIDLIAKTSPSDLFNLSKPKINFKLHSRDSLMIIALPVYDRNYLILGRVFQSLMLRLLKEVTLKGIFL